MVQFIRKGRPQEGTPPEPPKPTVRKAQESLFDPYYQPPKQRDPDAEMKRAADKFAQTNAGKQAGKAAAEATIKHATGAPKPAPAKIGFSCHLSHPPYEVAPGITILGGSGINPHHQDCDIYISLDQARLPGIKSLPWIEGEDFIFHIKNYGVPSDPDAFAHLIVWIAEQLKAGKKVHVGCMAGHGRTGLVLSALRMHMTGDKDAIMHVRNNYCDQVVETDAQIKWLVTHWGVNTAPPRVKKSAPPATKSAPIRKGWDADDAFGFDSANSGKFFDDDDELDDLQADPLTDFDRREPQHTSWQANSPWYKPVEGPPADLGEKPWYEDGSDGQ